MQEVQKYIEKVFEQKFLEGKFLNILNLLLSFKILNKSFVSVYYFGEIF